MNELTKLIKAKGYSIEQFCELADMSVSHFYYTQSHPKPMKNQTSIPFRMAKVLGISVDEVRRLSGRTYTPKHPLEKEIEKQGMTKMDFCAKYGIEDQTLRCIIKGERKPMPETIGYIADCLGVPEERLL